jgi:16S rRNA (guanine(966)-N(2))-methyltransferase RsmD
MPKGIRPTQDKVRKALFDILQDIEGLSFLELFAGSGAVGIEALSQGAKEVVFVEQDKRCAEAIKDNLSVIGLLSAKRICGSAMVCGGGYRVIGLDTIEAIKRLSQKKKKFDIIFSDPPYYMDLAKKTLQILGAYDILAPNGFIIMQHFKKDEIPKEAGKLKLIKESRYGDTVLSFYKK